MLQQLPRDQLLGTVLHPVVHTLGNLRLELAAPLEHGVKTEGEQGYPEVHQDNDRSLLGQQVVSVPEESQTEKLSRLACLRYCVLVA